ARRGDEPGAEVRAADPAEAIDPKEEVERPEGIDELDSGEVPAKPPDDQVPPAPELGHHPRHVLLHALVAERDGRGDLRGMVRTGRRMRLQRGRRLRPGAGRE